MAMTKCKECGTDISTTADACPKCGARQVRTSGCAKIVLAAIGLFVFVSIAGTCGREGSSGSDPDPSTSNSAEPAAVVESPPEAPVVAPTQYLAIKKLEWYKGGFDSVMFVNVTFSNYGTRDVKDIELKCTSVANSGTVIDSNTKTVYEVIPAGETKTIKRFSMGFINSQVARTNCEIESANFS